MSLTPQDIESYKKLRDAVNAVDMVEGIPGNDPFKVLIKALKEKLTKSERLPSFDELQFQVELTGGYLTIYQLLVEKIKWSITNADDLNKAKEKLNRASNELQIYYNQLKVSLDAIDSDFLDDVTTISSDPLFLRLLTDKDARNWTEKILRDQAPALKDGEVEKLINAWGTAVGAFAEDARKQYEPNGQANLAVPGQTETIARFFSIHDQLEGLYSELSTAIALNN